MISATKFAPSAHNRQMQKKKNNSNLTTEAVERTALALQRVDHV